ncbi:hypothetical protein OH76DRAFT_1199928 [Lentinus brumalis]|uniref:Uncharacterized protein n=1 Tax=Lentinus brumalis TaxID=2498619 RepID=A0A371CT51_9APHY|nr:hypothetical protein OH76DRAFT_1199928 [Polyporus brumalis]
MKCWWSWDLGLLAQRKLPNSRSSVRGEKYITRAKRSDRLLQFTLSVTVPPTFSISISASVESSRLNGHAFSTMLSNKFTTLAGFVVLACASSHAARCTSDRRCRCRQPCFSVGRLRRSSHCQRGQSQRYDPAFGVLWH